MPIGVLALASLVFVSALAAPPVDPVTTPAQGPTAAWAAKRFSTFVRAQSERLDAYAEPQSLAAASLPQILAERELAIDRLEALFDVRLDRRLALVFFATEESKLKATGHQGWGWALNDIIVEVHNAQIRLEPYHELSHIVSARLGSPPALFDEGAAVYVTERFGGDPMSEFDHPGMSIDTVVALNIDAGHYVPMRDVFAFSEIGSPKTQGTLTYPQAGSFVSFLVSQFGEAAFRSAFRRLRSSDDPAQIVENARTFREIFGVTIEDAEKDWRVHIGRPLAQH
jgi:hypothetical protein